MKSAVVTGANGFLGSALVLELKRHNVKVLAVARSHGRLEPDPQVERVTLELGELCTLASRTESRFDVFYHLAWAGTAGEARKDAALQLSGVHATVQAVHAAKALGCATFIGAGSIMEKELLAAAAPGRAPEPGHIYSCAKLAAHHMSQCVAAQVGIGHIWPVITNAYGEGESSPRLLNTTLQKIIQGEPLAFTAARQNYDFIHAEDAAKALRLLGERGKPFHEYVIGSGNARPLKEFLMELRDVLAPEREFLFGRVPFLGVSLPLAAFDIGPLQRDTGFSPQISFSRGVQRTMDWMRSVEQGCAFERI